jgi:hypothetical protein
MTLRNQHSDSVSSPQIRTLYRGLDRTVFSVLCLFTGVKNTADSSQPLRLYITLYRGIDYCIFGQLCNVILMMTITVFYECVIIGLGFQTWMFLWIQFRVIVCGTDAIIISIKSVAFWGEYKIHLKFCTIQTLLTLTIKYVFGEFERLP